MPRPRGEPAVGLVLAHRALVEADLEEVIERLADERTRLHTEERHHLPAVERRPNAIEFLLLAQLRDARFELVDTPVQRTRLRLVACGAVLSHEVVERLQQRTGV